MCIRDSREVYDTKLAEVVATADIDLVVLAGWNRLLSNVFLSKNTVINVHPALPGSFVGLGAIDRTWAGYKAGELTQGGVMVHYVPDEGVDDGPVICSAAVPIESRDTKRDFEARMHQTEHRLLVEAIRSVTSE